MQRDSDDEIIFTRAVAAAAWRGDFAKRRLEGATAKRAEAWLTPSGPAIDIDAGALAANEKVVSSIAPCSLRLRVKTKDAAACADLRLLDKVVALSLEGPAKALCQLLSRKSLKKLQHLELRNVTAKDLEAVNDALRAPLQSLAVVADGNVDAAAATLAECEALATVRRLSFASRTPACGAPMHEGPKRAGPLAGSGLAALARSAHLRAMESLTLANLEDVEGARALVAARWPKLRELRIDDIDEAAAKVLCASDRLEGVRILALGQLGGEGLTLLARNRAARFLEALAAWSGLQVKDPIRDPAFKTFVDSKHLQGLRALDAGDWSVGARGLSALAGGGMARLLSVDLCGVHLDRKAAEALGKARMAPRTLFLSLESHRLPGKAVGQAFAAMAPLLGSVERVGVTSVYEERGDDALAALSAATCPKLKTLFIGGSNQPSFTNAGAKTLLENQAFPALAMLRFTAKHYLGGGVGKAQLAKLQSRFTCSPDNLSFDPSLFRPVWPA